MELTTFRQDVVTGLGKFGTGRIRFKENSSFVVCGRSGSGKTTFISKLLLNADEMFENEKGRPIEILYCYSAYQDIYDKMYRKMRNIRFVQGLPDRDLLRKLISPKNRHLILVIDDLMRQALSSTLIFDFFTVNAHHQGTSIIYVSHNLFQQGEFSKAISLNSTYYCLFKNPRGADQIRTLSSQIYPGMNNAVVQAYNMATNAQKYGYLFLDMSINMPDELRMRTCIFPDEATRFYYPDDTL